MKYAAERKILWMKIVYIILFIRGIPYLAVTIWGIISITKVKLFWPLILAAVLAVAELFAAHYLRRLYNSTPKNAFILDVSNGTIYFPKEDEYINISDVVSVQAIPRVTYFVRPYYEFKHGKFIIDTSSKQYVFNNIKQCKSWELVLKSMINKIDK